MSIDLERMSDLAEAPWLGRSAHPPSPVKLRGLFRDAQNAVTSLSKAVEGMGGQKRQLQQIVNELSRLQRQLSID